MNAWTTSTRRKSFPDVLARLQAHWRLKLLLTVVLSLFFWTGYSFLGRHVFFPLRIPPLIWIDTAIPFQPEPWGWVYLSQFLFTGALPWLITEKDGLRRYVIGLVFMCVSSFLIFLFFPVAAPRPAQFSATGAMAWITGYDGIFNAFPSLHAGFLVYTSALGWRMFRRQLPRMVIAGAVFWGVLILYSTLATRQHYALDLVAGGLIGCVADWLAWRSSSGVNAATTIARSSGVASHDGCK
jgi:membrane-associated phospholipid phosphatase